MMDTLTVDELAGMLGVAPKTLANWRHAGGGPPFAKAGQRVLYRRVDVDRWLTDRTFIRTHQPARTGQRP